MWDEMLKSKVVRYQVSRIGMDSTTAEELYGKYGRGPLRDRQDFFNMLFVLKNDPSYDNVSWHTHSAAHNETIWKRFWDGLHFFNQV